MTRPTVGRLALAALLLGAGCELDDDEWGADLDDDVGSSEHAVLSSLQPGWSTTSSVDPLANRCAVDPIADVQAYSSTDRRHAGGMQVNGDYVVVPFEDHIDPRLAASFRTFNVSDPANSSSGPTVFRQRGDTKYGATAALTRINDGRFMVMVFGDDSADIEVFVSVGTTMPAAGSPTDWISKVSVGFDGSDVFDIQNVQFVTECDPGNDDTSGRLFAVATHKNPFGEDWVYLYRVTFEDPATYVPTFDEVTSGGNPVRRNMTCRSENTDDQRYCDFDAGAGVFVDGNGRLILYGVEHWNDHHDDLASYDDKAVKVREFSTH